MHFPSNYDLIAITYATDDVPSKFITSHYHHSVESVVEHHSFGSIKLTMVVHKEHTLPIKEQCKYEGVRFEKLTGWDYAANKSRDTDRTTKAIADACLAMTAKYHV